LVRWGGLSGGERGIRWTWGWNPREAPRRREPVCGRAWGMRSGSGRRRPWAGHAPRERRSGSRRGRPEAEG
jgi:hypothetical protein